MGAPGNSARCATRATEFARLAFLALRAKRHGADARGFYTTVNTAFTAAKALAIRRHE
jgi:hypothetical protein